MLFILGLGAFAFSEVMYDLPKPGEDKNREWAEVMNCSGSAAEIAKEFRFFDGGTHLINDPIQGMRTIPPGGVFILAADAKTATSTFFLEHPGFIGTVFDTAMSLNNTGDTLELRGEAGAVFASVSYQSAWGGQGTGKSIEKESPCDGNPNGGWRESLVMGGTPGRARLAGTATPMATPTVASPSSVAITPSSAPPFHAVASSVIPSSSTVPLWVPVSPTPKQTSPPAPTPAPYFTPSPVSLAPTPQLSFSPTPTYSSILVPSRNTEPSPNQSAALPSPAAPLLLMAPLINEFLPSPSGPDTQNEYVELVNPSDTALDISGWFLDDAEGGSLPYQIPSGTVMAPRGFLVFAAATTHIALNNNGDSVRLLQPGNIVSQSVTYGKAEEGHAYARKYDKSDQDLSGEPRAERAGEESGAWQWSSVPTPGRANVFVRETPKGQPAQHVSPARTISMPTSFASSTAVARNTDSPELDLAAMPPGEPFTAKVASADVRTFVLAVSMAISAGLVLVFARRFL